MKSDNIRTIDTATCLNTEINVSDLPFKALLNNLFTKRCFGFYDFDALVYHCDYSINTNGEFLPLPADLLNTYIRDNSCFDSRKEMLGDAVAATIEKQLNGDTVNHHVP